MIYAWIHAEKERNPDLSLVTACRILGVSRSGFYAWRIRLGGPPSSRQHENLLLLEEIRSIHHEFPAYGSPRVCHELRHRGRTVGVHRVARLMQTNGIKACRGIPKARPRSAPPRRRPEVPDLVRRRFKVDRPNLLWCIDVTQIRTRQGWLYAAVVIDAYSRMIISWTTSNLRPGIMAVDALDAAIRIRRPSPGGIVHSDRGYQFTAWEWLNRIQSAGLRPSIGALGSALDNALIESWFASFKNEALYPYPMPATKAQAREILFRHIHFHNRRRLHSALDYTDPTTYESATVST